MDKEHLARISEEVRRLYPERLTDEYLCEIWEWYGHFCGHPESDIWLLFAEVMQLREDLAHACQQLALQGRLIE